MAQSTTINIIAQDANINIIPIYAVAALPQPVSSSIRRPCKRTHHKIHHKISTCNVPASTHKSHKFTMHLLISANAIVSVGHIKTSSNILLDEHAINGSDPT